MSYSVENVNGCTKKISFNFETLDLTTEIKAALVKKQKEANIKGFRKGKAPLSMIEQMYRPQVESEALNQFINNQFFDAVKSEDLRIVGYPNIENMNYDSGKSVSFDAVVEIFPEVTINDYKGYSFTQEKKEVTDEDVENVKKNYLSQKAEMTEVEDDSVTLDKGLFAVFNFQGETENGERPENMKGEEFLLEIGSGQFIPGFEEQMVGLKKGDEKVLEVTFPEDYHAADLQNAKVKFEVEILEIKEKKYPELNDELAKEFGYESVEDFNTKNKENLVAQNERASKEKLHQEILEKLVNENSFDVPLALIAQQENSVKEELKRNLQMQGFNEDMTTEYFDKWKEDITTKAAFQVRSGLILDKLANEFGIETNDSDLDAKYDEMTKHSGIDLEQVKKYYESNEQAKSNLKYAVREEKTFEALKEKITIK